ncbi:MAG: glycosyltransferase family 39 protein, partial [Proteobacteria bacterium]|nr:glycosyltransferase family 39 protein [Pseudomonadota bacterium]
MADSRGRVAVCLLLLAAVAAVYEPVRNHAFVGLDDALLISANPHLRHGLTPDGLAWAFSVPDNENWIPLTQISYLIDYELHGLRPGPILLANAALHALAAVVLFLALVRMTGAPGRCAFVAAVFAVHPLHVESVAWAAERKDVLSALCFATTLWCYARYAERPTPGRYGAVAAALALGLLSKPMLVTAPVVLLLLDHWPLRRRALLEKLPLLALAAGSAAVTLVALRGTLAPEVLSLGLRLENATVSTATYLAAALWPSGLSIFYPYPVDGLPAARVAVSALVVAVPTALSLYALSARRWPWLPVGWFWYLGMLVPVVGILQAGAQARADRYTYLPLIGASI